MRNLAIRGAMMGASGGGVPTARDYMQDGLVAMWDGIENAGWGTHDPNATVWRDLIGGNEFNIPTTGSDVYSWTDNALKRIGINGITQTFPSLATASVEDEWTIEVIMSAPSTPDITSSAYYLFAWNVYDGRLFVNGSNTILMTSYASWYFTSEKSIPLTTVTNFVFKKSSDLYQDYTDRYISSLYVDGAVVRDIWTKLSLNGSFSLFRNVRNWPSETDMRCYSLRIYHRALTAAEIAANYAIDKARFGIA